jgi:hypothetical protein
MTGGGARPNQFRVELIFPSYVVAGILASAQAQFLCKAAQLPASTIENIPVQYRGRAVNFAGERTFAPWTVTVYNDTNFNVRNAMERWSNGIQNYQTTNGRVNPRDYQTDLVVRQLDRSGAIIKSYRFVDAYPISIGVVQLDYDTANAVETFDVEFQYNYFDSDTASRDGVGVNISIDTPIGSFPIKI